MAPQGTETARPKENVREMSFARILEVALHTSKIEVVKRLLDELDRRRLETIDREYDPKDERTHPEYKERLGEVHRSVKDLYNATTSAESTPGQPL